MQSFLTASVIAEAWISLIFEAGGEYQPLLPLTPPPGSYTRARSLRPERSASSLQLSNLELVDEFPDGRSRFLERRVLLDGERNLDDLLHPLPPKLHRHTDIEPADPVLPLEVRSAGQD